MKINSILWYFLVSKYFLSVSDTFFHVGQPVNKWAQEPISCTFCEITFGCACGLHNHLPLFAIDGQMQKCTVAWRKSVNLFCCSCSSQLVVIVMWRRRHCRPYLWLLMSYSILCILTWPPWGTVVPERFPSGYLYGTMYLCTITYKLSVLSHSLITYAFIKVKGDLTREVPLFKNDFLAASCTVLCTYEQSHTN